MPRYFFHLVDGTIDADDTGTELADAGAARVEAIRFAGASLHDDPHLLDDRRFRVIVADEHKQPLFLSVRSLSPSLTTISRPAEPTLSN